jgi:hypothetical protein
VRVPSPRAYRAVQAAGAAEVEVEVFEEGAEGLAEALMVRDPVLLAADRVGVLPG